LSAGRAYGSPGDWTRADIAINNTSARGGDRGPGKNREMGARSQVNWRRTCRQRPVWDYKGRRKDKAHQYLFRSVYFKCLHLIPFGLVRFRDWHWQ
jgi:hypothetical protein